MDRLEVVLEALLAALEHLLLHLQVAQVLRTLKFGLGLTLSLFLSHLVLDCHQLLLSILLFDLLLDFCPRSTDLIVFTQGLESLKLGSILHYLIFLLNRICSR